ncbi:alpha/beta-hydrolase, partial [Conidiobolus coronatus NRRL 28638]
FIKYAGAAYCPKDKLLNWSCANCNGYASGGSEVKYFADVDTSTAGYLAVNNGQKAIIVGFRGTQDITNWIGNVNISFTNANLPSPFQNADIHSGFNKMTNVLLPSVEAALSSAKAKYPNYKIIFTGHSLGGAIATLTAYRLAQKNVIGWDRVNLITFGQPRVGDPEFASFLNTKPMYSTRVTSYADLVAISPGKSMGYGHSQYNMHINKNGQTVKCS